MNRIIRNALVGGATATGIVALVAVAPLAFSQEGEEAEEPTYRVEDGAADPDTVQGYVVYTAQCMPCHGPDGLGSSFAPSLVRAAERRTFAQFEEVVRDGRSVMPGQVMPAFGDAPHVMDHVDDIWRYLKARAEGALGRGRPVPIAEPAAGEEAEETG
jgi:mono/diheme cytochrome c family protein